MLSNETTIEEEKEGNVQWFNRLLVERGIKEVIFEHNEFVDEYLKGLRSSMNELETLTKSQTLLMAKEIVKLQRLEGRNRQILELLNVELYDNDRDLAMLMAECDTTLVSPTNTVMAIDKIVNAFNCSKRELLKVNELEERTLDFSNEINKLSQNLFKSKNEFDQWARKDCELGIKELQNATTVVLTKKQEYQERLGRLKEKWNMLTDDDDGQCDVLATKTMEKLDEIKVKQTQLQDLQSSLDIYNGLSPDPALAAVKVEESRRILEMLMTKRDSLLKAQLNQK